jgi:hypothetical protein
MKICPVEAKLFHKDGEAMDGLAEGQTHMTKLTLAFHNFMNIQKMTNTSTEWPG